MPPTRSKRSPLIALDACLVRSCAPQRAAAGRRAAELLAAARCVRVKDLGKKIAATKEAGALNACSVKRCQPQTRRAFDAAAAALKSDCAAYKDPLDCARLAKALQLLALKGPIDAKRAAALDQLLA